MEDCAYLDIETTGLSLFSADVTVIGVSRDSDKGVIQLVGDDISSSRLVDMLEGIGILYTYNGARFDLPFIREKLGVDLMERCEHRDLMYSCWKRNLYGGLKAVERQLGIRRKFPDIDGWVAVRLWMEYRYNGDIGSLEKLLQYNREDVLNLRILRQKLSP